MNGFNFTRLSFKKESQGARSFPQAPRSGNWRHQTHNMQQKGPGAIPFPRKNRSFQSNQALAHLMCENAPSTTYKLLEYTITKRNAIKRFVNERKFTLKFHLKLQSVL